MAFVIATVQCGSLVMVISRPRIGAAAHLISTAALVLLTRDSAGEPWPLPVTGLVSLGALILVLGIRERWIVSLTTWWLSVALLVALVAASPGRNVFPDLWGTNLTIYASYTAIVLVAAIAVGQRHRIRSELAEARRDVELEQAQRRLAEERARIARELHDLVAHSMSLIHMQALSAPIRLAGSTRSTVDDEFLDIARSARSALAEMRQLLGALRSEGDDAELAPQPQLSDIDELVAATSRVGISIELDVDPAAAAASPVVQLTAYRVVREALSNVVRHAPDAPTTVQVRVQGDALHVTVQNAPPPVRPDADGGTSPDPGGQGIRGMRERVTLIGGRLITRSTTDGGYLVDATIPAAIPSTVEIR